METNSINLYDLIGVSRQATQAELTKAYRLMALKVHPDKNISDPETAQKNFQRLNEAYNILSDPRRRQIYDATGQTDSTEDFFEAYEYYRGIYPKINTQDIDDFAVKYKGSKEEIEDLTNFYLDQEGDMKQILYCIPLSDKNDLPRFWQILDGLINDNQIPKKKIYATSKKKVKNIKETKGEIIEEEEISGKKQNNDISSLIAKIKQRPTKNPDDFFTYLEEKYAEKPYKKKKNK
jgi:DnaJ homolog subfamily C member 9